MWLATQEQIADLDKAIIEELRKDYEANDRKSQPIETGDDLKKDDGKERFDLIPAEPMLELAALFATGANKYYDRCWEEGMSWGRIFGAMMRHGWKWWRGEKLDPIDGQHHLIAVAWCAFALFTYELRGSGTDDRP